MYKRLPFGISCASDYFSKMFSDLFSDLENVVVHVDDVLIFSDTLEEHKKILSEVLRRLSNEGVTLNKDKCELAVSKLEFVGPCYLRKE